MDPDADRLQRALDLAVRAHGTGASAKFRSLDIAHVVEVANALHVHYPDRPHLAVAGLLHDPLGGPDTTAEDLRRDFGGEIATLVEALTLPQNDDPPQEASQESLIERILATAEARLHGEPLVAELREAHERLRDAIAQVRPRRGWADRIRTAPESGRIDYDEAWLNADLDGELERFPNPDDGPGS